MCYSNRVKRTLSLCVAIIFFGGITPFSLDGSVVWTQPVNLSLPGKNAVSPRINIDSSGTATAVWSRSNGANYVIEVAQGKINKQWTAPGRISYIGQNAFFADVVVGASNNSVAVWSRSNGISNVIQMASKVSGKNWSAPTNLSAKGGAINNAVKPQIAADADGNLSAIWQRHNGVNNIIQVAQQLNNGVWSNPENLTRANPSGLGNINPQIGVDGQADLYAVWLNDSTSTIQGATKKKFGNWSSPLNLSASGQKISAPCLCVGAEGVVSVAWSRFDGSNYVVQVISSLAGGRMSPVLDLSVSGQDAINPQVAIDKKGNAVVVWQRFDGVNTIVQGSFRPAGLSWLVPIDLSISGEDASSPCVAIDKKGNCIIAWKRSNGSNFVIEATSVNFKNLNLSTPVALSLPGEDAICPQLALDNTGNVVIVWQRSDGFNSIVQAVFGINH